MSRSKSNSKNSCQPETIENIVQADNLTYDCICPKTTRDLQVSERTQTCYHCSRDYHTNCLWPLQDTPGQYQCPLCFLIHCLPERKVKQILFGGYLRQTKKNKIQYRINLPLDSDLVNHYPIQARCVRLNKQNKYEITWPQHCSLHLNHKKIAQFKPLHSTASIKRRVDEQIVLDKKLLALDSALIIEEKHQYIQGMRKDGNSCHFVIIAAIEPQSADDIQEEMKHRYLSVEHSKHRLREYLNRGGQDCVVQKLKVPLKCQFYSNKITIPVRSKHCRMHYQPFDLRGFIMANINSKLSVGKWKCPICKKRAYDLQVDQYLLKIIHSDSSLAEIYFNKQAQLQLFAQSRALIDKDQPSLATNPGSDHYSHEEIKGEGREVYIKKESKNNLNESNSCQQIPVVQESSQKSKIIFQECIELLDDDDQPIKPVKPKRSYRFRNNTYNLAQPPVKQPRKRQKKEVNKMVVQPEADSSSVRPIESREVNIYRSQEEQSHFSDQEFHTKPDKKKKPKRNYHRERVGIDPPVRNIEKMAKTLVPSPSIITVTPSGIRITQSRVSQPKKTAQHHPVIEIVETEQQSPQSIRQKKLHYHLQQLQRDRRILEQQGEKDQISQSQTANFLTLCDHFLNSLLRT